MSIKKILTIGLQLASDDAHYESIDSKLSLLDWDIILIKPEIGGFSSYGESDYMGKRCLTDRDSFRLKECCEHWRREIRQAYDTGKTVIVYLPPLDEVFVATGDRTYSGTGRNRQTTRHVALLTNYDTLPVAVGPVSASGSSMKLVSKGFDVLAPYWAEFEGHSGYEVLLTADKVPTCLLTKSGDKSVGALYRSKSSSGSLLLLPDIDFEPDDFIEGPDGKQTWTAAATQFAGKFVSSIVNLDKALRSESEVTPEPVWAADGRYSLGPEANLRVQLLEAERKVEQAQREKEAVADRISEVSQYRALLFEKGKRLERVVVDALRKLGFTAAPFRDSNSEFDVVFSCPEGRLIGEAEGKDNKPISIEKLRQLSMNVHEDLQREEVTAPAKPVLFGNGFRLQSVLERPDPFTEKCRTAASSSSTALVHTPDLFVVVQYLLSQDDAEYATACRGALIGSVGRVVFPPVPVSPSAQPEGRNVEVPL